LALTDWRQPPAAEDLFAAEYSGAFVWASLFTTLGYIGGEVIAPWLHILTSISSMASGWCWLSGLSRASAGG
jgi:membrane protein DedA with SNARE-associated domain